MGDPFSEDLRTLSDKGEPEIICHDCRADGGMDCMVAVSQEQLRRDANQTSRMGFSAT